MDVVLEVRDAEATLSSELIAIMHLRTSVGGVARDMLQTHLIPLFGNPSGATPSLAPGVALYHSTQSVDAILHGPRVPNMLQCRLLNKQSGAHARLISVVVVTVMHEADRLIFGEVDLQRMQLAFERSGSATWRLVAVAARPVSQRLRPALDALSPVLKQSAEQGQGVLTLKGIADVVITAFSTIATWRQAPVDADETSIPTVLPQPTPREVREMAALLHVLRQALASFPQASELLEPNESDWLITNLDEWEELAALGEEDLRCHLASEAGAQDKVAISYLEDMCNDHAARRVALNRLLKSDAWDGWAHDGSKERLKEKEGWREGEFGNSEECGLIDAARQQLLALRSACMRAEEGVAAVEPVELASLATEPAAECDLAPKVEPMDAGGAGTADAPRLWADRVCSLHLGSAPMPPDTLKVQQDDIDSNMMVSQISAEVPFTPSHGRGLWLNAEAAPPGREPLRPLGRFSSSCDASPCSVRRTVTDCEPQNALHVSSWVADQARMQEISAPHRRSDAVLHPRTPGKYVHMNGGYLGLGDDGVSVAGVAADHVIANDESSGPTKRHAALSSLAERGDGQLDQIGEAMSAPPRSTCVGMFGASPSRLSLPDSSAVRSNGHPTSIGQNIHGDQKPIPFALLARANNVAPLTSSDLHARCQGGGELQEPGARAAASEPQSASPYPEGFARSASGAISMLISAMSDDDDSFDDDRQSPLMHDDLEATYDASHVNALEKAPDLDLPSGVLDSSSTHSMETSGRMGGASVSMLVGDMSSDESDADVDVCGEDRNAEASVHSKSPEIHGTGCNVGAHLAADEFSLGASSRTCSGECSSASLAQKQKDSALQWRRILNGNSHDARPGPASAAGVQQSGYSPTWEDADLFSQPTQTDAQAHNNTEVLAPEGTASETALLTPWANEMGPEARANANRTPTCASANSVEASGSSPGSLGSRPVRSGRLSTKHRHATAAASTPVINLWDEECCAQRPAPCCSAARECPRLRAQCGQSVPELSTAFGHPKVHEQPFQSGTTPHHGAQVEQSPVELEAHRVELYVTDQRVSPRRMRAVPFVDEHTHGRRATASLEATRSLLTRSPVSTREHNSPFRTERVQAQSRLAKNDPLASSHPPCDGQAQPRRSIRHVFQRVIREEDLAALSRGDSSGDESQSEDLLEAAVRSHLGEAALRHPNSGSPPHAGHASGTVANVSNMVVGESRTSHAAGTSDATLVGTGLHHDHSARRPPNAVAENGSYAATSDGSDYRSRSNSKQRDVETRYSSIDRSPEHREIPAFAHSSAGTLLASVQCSGSQYRRKRRVIESDSENGEPSQELPRRRERAISAQRLGREESQYNSGEERPRASNGMHRSGRKPRVVSTGSMRVDMPGGCDGGDERKRESVDAEHEVREVAIDQDLGEAESEHGLGEEDLDDDELLELQADALERDRCVSGGGEMGDALHGVAEDDPDETLWGGNMDASVGDGFDGDVYQKVGDGGLQVSLPCEVCGELVPAMRLQAHQADCARTQGQTHVLEDTDGGDNAASCAFCGVPQALSRLDAHEALCSTRSGVGAHRSAPSSTGRAPLTKLRTITMDGVVTPTGNQASSDHDGLPSRGHWLPPSQHHGQTHRQAPAHSPKSRFSRMNRHSPLQDDIEESSDEDTEGFGADSRRAQPPMAEVAQTNVPTSASEALFPNFRSLTALQRDRVWMPVDYLSQFGGNPTCGRNNASGVPAASIHEKGKAKGRARKPRRNTWRNINGRKVYFDEKGQQSVGRIAYRKSTVAKASGVAKKRC